MSRKTVEVYAHWQPLAEPLLVGYLSHSLSGRNEVFSFEYTPKFLQSKHRQQLDPELLLHSGQTYPATINKNFRIFLDSSPDRWGRILMQRRAAIEFKKGLRESSHLTELDYLLGVHDSYRMGGLRFKTTAAGNFLDDNQSYAAPPITSLRELEYAALQIEKDENIDSADYYRWLQMLISPGSSLGGARPKASVIDENKHLWIAKFPNASDEVDVGAWEFLCYQLAIKAGIEMFPCKIQRYSSPYHTFLTKRFDRKGEKRIHFSSAMTQLEYYDGEDAEGASYLELAEFLTNYGSNTQADLAQLWRRLVFNLAISNTDDHLRNHGFLLTNKGWQLSPAYDLNPLVSKRGLHLNITDNDNSLDYGLAFKVAEFFNLTKTQANKIYDEVLTVVSRWQELAQKLGIGRAEQLIKQAAFNL